MSAQERTLLTTRRDCPARLVPVGDPLLIPAHTFVTLTQALGGNYTLVYNGNMVRVDGTDADALGLEPLRLNFPVPQDDRIDIAQVWEALHTVYDPEIPVDLVNLGLIYSVKIDQEAARVDISMTLTAPGCGMGPVIAADAQARILTIDGIDDARVELVWDPAWNQDMISEEGKMKLGML